MSRPVSTEGFSGWSVITPRLMQGAAHICPRAVPLTFRNDRYRLPCSYVVHQYAFAADHASRFSVDNRLSQEKTGPLVLEPQRQILRRGLVNRQDGHCLILLTAFLTAISIFPPRSVQCLPFQGQQTPKRYRTVASKTRRTALRRSPHRCSARGTPRQRSYQITQIGSFVERCHWPERRLL